VRVEVGGHDPSPPPGRRESRQARSRSDLEEPGSGRDLREGKQEQGILPGRIDPRPIAREVRGIGCSSRSWPGGTMASYWLHAYNLS